MVIAGIMRASGYATARVEQRNKNITIIFLYGCYVPQIDSFGICLQNERPGVSKKSLQILLLFLT